MDWMEITVLTSTAGADMVSQILMDAGSSGTMIEDRNDVALNQRPEGQWVIIDEEIARRIGDDVKVTGYYEVDAGLNDRVRFVEGEIRRVKGMDLGFDAGKLEILQQTFAEEDWAENWKKAFKPLRLGRHMLVKPGWADCEVLPGDRVIEIDPGMAFGTGTHETTGMCVELVEKYVSPGVNAIDVGTGTGILAIAAAYMGARDVLAIDIDPVAVRVARDNIVLNGLADKITAREGDLLEAVDEVADVVIANIIADVICMLAEPVKAHIKKNGLFICSGIARERQDEVISALNAAGYQDLDVRNQGEWAAICARRV